LDGLQLDRFEWRNSLIEPRLTSPYPRLNQQNRQSRWRWLDRIISIVFAAAVVYVCASVNSGVIGYMLMLLPAPLTWFMNRWTGVILTILALPYMFATYAACDIYNGPGSNMLHLFHEWDWIFFLFGFVRMILTFTPLEQADSSYG